MVDSALRYRAQVPLIDSLLKEVDLKGDSSSGLTDFIRHQMESSGDFEQSKGKTKKQARVADAIDDYDEPAARSAPRPARASRSHEPEATDAEYPLADEYVGENSPNNVIEADHDGNADNRG